MFRIHPQVKKPFQILCAVLLIAIGVSPAVASPGPTWREATLSVLPNQSSISVSIPEGAKRVAVEVKNAKGSWVRLSNDNSASIEMLNVSLKLDTAQTLKARTMDANAAATVTRITNEIKALGYK